MFDHLYYQTVFTAAKQGIEFFYHKYDDVAVLEFETGKAGRHEGRDYMIAFIRVYFHYISKDFRLIVAGRHFFRHDSGYGHSALIARYDMVPGRPSEIVIAVSVNGYIFALAVDYIECPKPGEAERRFADAIVVVIRPEARSFSGAAAARRPVIYSGVITIS